MCRSVHDWLARPRTTPTSWSPAHTLVMLPSEMPPDDITGWVRSIKVDSAVSTEQVWFKGVWLQLLVLKWQVATSEGWVRPTVSWWWVWLGSGSNPCGSTLRYPSSSMLVSSNTRLSELLPSWWWMWLGSGSNPCGSTLRYPSSSMLVLSNTRLSELPLSWWDTRLSLASLLGLGNFLLLPFTSVLSAIVMVTGKEFTNNDFAGCAWLLTCVVD